MKSSIIFAHIAVFAANLIYGLNYVVAKGIMPDYLAPRAIIFIRVSGALLLFLLFHFLFVKEKVEKKDYGRFALCAVFGVALNQIMFFEGLNLTTPINSSIIMTINPIIVLVFSSILIKERITFFKLFGIVLGALGAILLISQKGSVSFSSDTFVGNMLIVVNASSFALYLVLVKPLMVKYKPVTVMKWVFIFGFIYIFPFSIKPFVSSDFQAVPVHIWLSVLYVVLMSTFFGYLLYNIALRQLSPTVTSTYMYLQPFFASIFSFLLFADQPGIIDYIASVLIFIGVYIVSKKKLSRFER